MDQIVILPAHVAQLAEHILGKNEVMGSNPIMGLVPRLPAKVTGFILKDCRNFFVKICQHSK